MKVKKKCQTYRVFRCRGVFDTKIQAERGDWQETLLNQKSILRHHRDRASGTWMETHGRLLFLESCLQSMNFLIHQKT